MCERPITPRTVRPRGSVTGVAGVTDNPGPSIVAVCGQDVWVESSDELRPIHHLPSIVVTHQPALFVAQDSGHVLRGLDDTFQDHPDWQFRVTPVDREIWKPNREGQPTTVRSVVINWFGFKRPEGTKAPNRYHQVVDPSVFLHRFTLDDLAPPRGDETDLMRLVRWGTRLRDWATSHSLSMRPSSGGLAAQLLRDQRFYPDPRRKVPRATNRRARDVLPGNYYDLRVVEEKERQHFSATYLDQVSAHHNAAAVVPLPDADRLYAKGRFHKLEGKMWARKGTRVFDNAITGYGLFYLRVKNPFFRADRFILPCQRKQGWQDVYVWSNELDFLRETGTEIVGIIAAWTSDHRDLGIPSYARWALGELKSRPKDAGWLKPTLLSAYGILASRPRHFETAYRRSEKGDRAVYAMGGSLLEVQRYRAQHSHETAIANVIQRGIIEAETRLRSIQMAAHLDSFGLRVLAIYADSVFIENHGQGVPLIGDGWQIKGHLDRLEFFNSTSFTSDQLTKLPGIPKDDLDRLRRVQSAKSFFAELKKIENGGRRTRKRPSRGSVRPSR